MSCKIPPGVKVHNKRGIDLPPCKRLPGKKELFLTYGHNARLRATALSSDIIRKCSKDLQVPDGVRRGDIFVSACRESVSYFSELGKLYDAVKKCLSYHHFIHEDLIYEMGKHSLSDILTCIQENQAAVRCLVPLKRKDEFARRLLARLAYQKRKIIRIARASGGTNELIGYILKERGLRSL